LAGREFFVWSRGVSIAGEDGRGDFRSESSVWPWVSIVELGKVDNLGSEAYGAGRWLADILLVEVLTEVWRKLAGIVSCVAGKLCLEIGLATF
jgi:hypothetical protein